MTDKPVLTKLVVEDYDHGGRTGIAWRYSDGTQNSRRIDDIFPPEVVTVLMLAVKDFTNLAKLIEEAN